jgi:hypothetical protein
MNREFTSLLNDLSTEEIQELSLIDPSFLDTFCYMLTLELQLEREKITS